MVFNSLTFLAFFAVVLLLYYRLGLKGQNWLLLISSYIFYGWWNYRFCSLLLFTTLFDYTCALWIARETNPVKRRLLLASSMTVNLGVLGLFKYFNFFAESLQTALGVFGLSPTLPTLHILLPVGVSFYTFVSMSYTIDVYRGELKASRDPVAFMLFVAFFPHLVAGPIVRASFLLPQCLRPRQIIPEEVANGIWLILMGYVKKVVIADRLAQIVNWGFSKDSPPFSDANNWLLIYAFAFQIYGDFAGYSDIARGVSKLMGFELIVNFRAPYLVTNAASFWRHWHISLSTWLRDYLYIPLGGNRHGRWQTYRNLGLTMFLGGLWHGAGGAYVLWGVYHGALLAIQRAWADLTGKRHVTPEVEREAAAPVLAAAQAVPAPALTSVGEGSRFALARAGTSAVAEPLVSTASEATARAAVSQVAPQRPQMQFDKHKGATRNDFDAGGWPLFSSLRTAVLVLVFFHLTCIGWLFFRAGALPAHVNQLQFVRQYLHTMLVVPRRLDPMLQGVVFLGLLSLFFQWKSDVMNHFSRWPLVWQTVGVVAALSLIAGLGVFEGAQFIYFQF
jgi:D-alanyl-lipoteichoic acid acyltransferase DltB (MBOAT superfamily)